MKRFIYCSVAGALLLTGTITTQAAIIDIDLSPAGGTALNLGPAPTHYFGDHAVGITAPNAVGMPPSPATGGEIGPGITFDTVTKMLTFDIAYGGAHGFVDLTGSYFDAHIHGPSTVMFPAPNVGAGVVIPLGAFHAPSTLVSGTIVGSVMLTPPEEMMLFDNALYINIHSSSAPGGEIRGQFVPVPEPSTAALVMLGALALRFCRRRA